MVLQAASFAMGLADANVFAACPINLNLSVAVMLNLSSFKALPVGRLALQRGLSAAGPAKRAAHVPHETWEERRKGAGNSQPAKRVPFPELSHEFA